MLKAMRERTSQEEGFTLIELMVVVLIIAVLVAIAIPSFLGFRVSAQDRAAQTVLRNGVLAQKGYWTDNQGYASTQANLSSFETSIVVGTDTVGEIEIPYLNNAVAGGEDSVCMQSPSDSGHSFGVFIASASPEEYNSSNDSTVDLCDGSGQVVGNAAHGTWTTGGFPAVP